MLSELPKVSSARAAQIVGVGYEGFRSYLKRGLLGTVGMLPGFYNNKSDPVRSRWTMFGFADLCLMRLAKILMDRGFSFESANAAVSQRDIWSWMQHDDEPTDRFLLMWPPYGDHMYFNADQLHMLPKSLAEAAALKDGVYTLVNLGDIQAYVAEALAPSN